MPQPFEQAVLTDKGEELLAKVTGGQGQIEYVCMVIGCGIYSNEERKKEFLKKTISLKEEKNRYAFSAVRIEGKNVRLTALLTNQDPLTSEGLITKGYYINEVGIYAKEQGAEKSTAILYSICLTAGDMGMGDYMPEYNGGNRSEIIQDYILSVNESTRISVNMFGAVALAKDVERRVSDAMDAAYQQGTGYTDQKIADLINGAPDTLDTLGELAQAMQDNADVVQALNQAIGNKANEVDFMGHANNDTIHIATSERQAWNHAAALLAAITAGEKITEVKIVNTLPADAAAHPTTFYWVQG